MSKLDELAQIETISFSVLKESIDIFRSDELAVPGAVVIPANLQTAFNAWHVNFNAYKEELASISAASVPPAPATDTPVPAAGDTVDGAAPTA